MFNPYFNRAIGARILQTRTKKGITQNAFAISLGFSPQFLGRVEKGAVRIPEKSLLKAMKLLNIPKTDVVAVATRCASEYAESLFIPKKKK